MGIENFKNTELKFRISDLFIYNLGKFIQYYIYNYLINFKLSKIKSK